jgi:hypothetical protein
MLATQSFATDLLYILPVAKSSIATIAAVATDDVAIAKLSIATVATNHVAVAKLSVATVATDQIVSVATPLSQPSQPSQPVDYLRAELSSII